MSDDVIGMTTHQQLISLLTEQGARFRVIEHEAVGKCEAVSEIRGTALGQGAKALVCKVKGNGVKTRAGDPRRRSAGRFKPAGEPFRWAESLTRQPGGSGCAYRLRFRRHSPFSFHPDLTLVADPLLFERFDEIAFNAGLLEKSVVMDTRDYLRIARPERVTFRKG